MKIILNKKLDILKSLVYNVLTLANNEKIKKTRSPDRGR